MPTIADADHRDARSQAGPVAPRGWPGLIGKSRRNDRGAHATLCMIGQLRRLGMSLRSRVCAVGATYVAAPGKRAEGASDQRPPARRVAP